MRALKGIATLVVATVIALTAGSSATAQFAYVVSMASCAEDEGVATVPAGSTVVVEETWPDTRPSAVSRFLRVQQTRAAVNGTVVTNASSLWGPITSANGRWATTWTYATGITLTNPGDSLIVSFDITLTKRLRTGDGTVHEAGSVVGNSTTCTITAT